MSYVLTVDHTVGDAVRRIAAEQLDDAIALLSETIDEDPTEAIHAARKCCKKVRGLVRAVRPSLGDEVYHVANGSARDAAHELSDLRDATALMETFQLAVDRADVETTGDDDAAVVIRSVAQALTLRHLDAQSQSASDHPRVERARELLIGLRAACGRWELAEDGWDAIDGGVHKTYHRGRSAFETAVDAPTGENFHEWRKRVKYTWYHLRLIGETAPTVLDPLADAFHDLSDALGDAHDMHVLVDALPGLGDDIGDTRPVEQLLGGYRSVLERRSLTLGARLYAESKSAFTDRLGTYWSAHERFGPEGEIGDIDALW